MFKKFKINHIIFLILVIVQVGGSFIPIWTFIYLHLLFYYSCTEFVMNRSGGLKVMDFF